MISYKKTMYKGSESANFYNYCNIQAKISRLWKSCLLHYENDA